MRVLAALLVLLLSGCATTLVPVEVTRIVEVIVTATPEPATPTPPPHDGAFDTGPLRWRVLAAQDKGQTVILGGNDFAEQTEGRFVWIVLRIDNTGKEPFMYGYVVDTVLIDNQGRTFAEFTSSHQNNDLCWKTRLNPGLGAECFIVFDVAPDAADLQLSLEVGNSRAEVPITLAPLVP